MSIRSRNLHYTNWGLAAITAILMALASAACAEDEIAEAMESVNRKIAAAPQDGSLFVQRSRLYKVGLKFDLALKDLDQAQRLKGAINLDRERAEVYLAAGWYETGLDFATRHIKGNPNDRDGYRVRAQLLVKLGKHAEAGDDYAVFVQRSSPSAEMYLEYAAALTTPDGAYLDRALTALNEGLKRLGPVYSLEIAALEVEMQKKDFDAALKRVNGVMGRMSRKDIWLAKRGDILVQAERFEEARQAYEEALQAIGALPNVQKNREATHALERDVRKALANSREGALQAARQRNTQVLASTPREQLPPPDGLTAPTNPPAMPPGGKIRNYYIAAEEVDWHYAPGADVLQEPFCGDPDAFLVAQTNRIGQRFKKAIYRGYTDETFQRLEVRPANWRHLGILGPLIRAEVGDRIRVSFTNKTRFPTSVHPHGVFYLKTSEGSGYSDGTSSADKRDDVVKPGGSHVYEWFVPERAGPGPSDGSSLVWLYHSHVQATKDANAGLIGAMIVTAKGKANPDGTPKDVDREFVTLFNIFDENQSLYFDANLKTFLPGSRVNTNDFLFMESNRKHSINGYLFANLPMMTMHQGERARWYLLAMGSESDLHTAHWHGNSVLHHGYRTDVVELLPASMKVADMIADNPGVWMYHCHVNDHMQEGMSARFEVLQQQTKR